jgi:demethylmenaquinone methyltransferase/2-methoxy-6-polyprenyl-1,4-benzoquinol methylase
MPFAGRVLAGSAGSYACLSETIRMFVTPQELAAVFEEAGFADVSYMRLTNGIAAIHIGKKA